MSWADPEILEELGNFAISFSFLEDFIGTLTCLILQTKEYAVALCLVDDLTAGGKLALLKKVSKLLADRYGVVRPYETLSEAIESAQRVIEHRNTILHGSLTHQEGQPLSMQLRKKSVPLSKPELSKLVLESNKVVPRLSRAFTEFETAISKAREAESEATGAAG